MCGECCTRVRGKWACVCVASVGEKRGSVGVDPRRARMTRTCTCMSRVWTVWAGSGARRGGLRRGFVPGKSHGISSPPCIVTDRGLRVRARGSGLASSLCSRNRGSRSCGCDVRAPETSCAPFSFFLLRFVPQRERAESGGELGRGHGNNTRLECIFCVLELRLAAMHASWTKRFKCLHIYMSHNEGLLSL